ncbi:CaiB/BaiF CoA transferase family protein [Rhabdothermincola salaria]|uniref:CaiB/BaiF CoA transferase family protein n=1 Tax=Rhabdothermincola salaria TaxID=2903142 RepID=UPI001E48CD53|nr:CaiB/BaiF CoA-transferase family protein [Rhabdothermincola salaria]MCD9624982.1 CoA transferase [Rhabdothermincola salaria]
MGPLAGVKVVEIAGIGPGPFAAMMLADMGADVVRVDRASSAYGGDPAAPPKDVMNRGRRSVAVDLKHPDGVATVLELVAGADALVEGFRPGVMERLGLGPEVCLGQNPRLVYGRMTGWGQEGPMASMAGHDMNYISIAGVLGAIGRPDERPQPPLNLIGDFGGGGLMLAFGIVCGVLEARTSGQGQVIDAAMVDGSAVLTTFLHGFKAMGIWSDERGANMLDSGAHYYEVYECADGRFLSVGAIEPQFYAILLDKTGLADDPDFARQSDRSLWPALKERLAAVIATKTRDEWAAIFDGTDACVVPVLGLGEAPTHPHNVARENFVTRDEVVQPAPAPRFSRTSAEIQRPPAHAGQHTDEVLAEWAGLDADTIAARRAAGAVA